MVNEPAKTGIMLTIALVSAIVAFTLMPTTIDIENQERVNQPLFPAFETSEVRALQIQGLLDPKINLSQGSDGPSELTMRLTNKGWFIKEFDNFPAGNNKLIGELAASLSNLKVVEVLSENPSEMEISEYGLVAPDGTNLNREEVGVRLALMDAMDGKLAEIIVGKKADSASQKASYYVRSTMESGIFRVQIDKNKMEPYLLSWIDPNPLEIRVPEGLPVVNAGYRTIEKIMVATSPATPEAYRAYFQFSGVPLQKLEIRRDDQWVETERTRLQADANFSQSWLMGLQAIPAVIYMADVEKKSVGLQQAMQVGKINKNFELAELKGKGYQVVQEDSNWLITGDTGRAVIDASNGLRFNLVFGKPTKTGLLPLIMYAEASPNSNVTPPTKEELPEEAKDWDEQKRKSELDLIERKYQEQKLKYQQYIDQLSIEITKTNNRTSPWIYYVPADVITQLIPKIRLSAEAPAAAEQPEDQATDQLTDDQQVENQPDSETSNDSNNADDQ